MLIDLVRVSHSLVDLHAAPIEEDKPEKHDESHWNKIGVVLVIGYNVEERIPCGRHILAHQ